jgi:hypothetical protein
MLDGFKSSESASMLYRSKRTIERTRARSHGWSVKGRRAEVKSFFVRKKRWTLEMAMSCRGALSYRIFPGSMDSIVFLEFLEHDLVF